MNLFGITLEQHFGNKKNKLTNDKSTDTLPETNNSPRKFGFFKGKDRLPTINFSGAFAVSFREGRSPLIAV